MGKPTNYIAVAKENTFKICLIGDGGVGKTTLLKRCVSGVFEKRYIPTMGVELDFLTFNTNSEPIRFNVWDTAGQEKFHGLGEGYYIEADACIAMFDLTSVLSLRNLKGWIHSFRNVCPNVPIVLLGNKVDIIHKKVTSKQINEFMEDYENITYYAHSSKSNFNFHEPFLYLAKELKGNDLTFV